MMNNNINERVRLRVERYKEIKALRDNGEYLAIPFNESFPKLAKYMPGIMKGVMYKITSGSGVGKTQLAKSMFVIAALEFMRKHPELNMDIRILYFALEESEDEFIDILIVNTLAMKHGIRIDVLELRGFKERFADDKMIRKIEECIDNVSFYMNHIEVVSNEYNPTGKIK